MPDDFRDGGDTVDSTQQTERDDTAGRTAAAYRRAVLAELARRVERLTSELHAVQAALDVALAEEERVDEPSLEDWRAYEALPVDDEGGAA